MIAALTALADSGELFARVGSRFRRSSKPAPFYFRVWSSTTMTMPAEDDLRFLLASRTGLAYSPTSRKCRSGLARGLDQPLAAAASRVAGRRLSDEPFEVANEVSLIRIPEAAARSGPVVWFVCCGALKK